MTSCPIYWFSLSSAIHAKIIYEVSSRKKTYIWGCNDCAAVLLPLATYSQASSWFCEHVRAEAFPRFLYSQHLPLPCFPGGSDSKESAVVWETWVPSLGREDPLEEGMAAHPSILSWRIPGTEEPGGLQFMGSQRVRHDWSSLAHTSKSIKMFK